jgi:hypothetical protein
MDNKYSSLVDYSTQLATICQKLQLKWSPTLYYRMAQGVHFEILKINNK